MSGSVKEIFVKYIFSFLFLSTLAYFWKWLDMSMETAFFMSLGMGICDFIIYMVRKYRNKKKIE